MKDELKALLDDGQFKEAKELIKVKKITVQELGWILLEMGSDNDNSLTPYLFVSFLLLIQESAELHALASDLMSLPYAWMSGAYSVGLVHMEKAIKLSPNDMSYKQAILLFYDIPEQLLSEDKAREYAKEVLEKDPTVSVARNILENRLSQ